MRTTEKMLDGLVNRLNSLTGNAPAPYSKNADGKHVANIGNYHLDWAYSGVKLVQMMNAGGGIRTITLGYETKANCYSQIAAYIAGIEDCIRDEKAHNATIKKPIG